MNGSRKRDGDGAGPPADRRVQRVVPRVALAVAEREGVDAAALPPLQEAIEADALERLVGGARGSGGLRRVVFEYLGYEITVRGNGTVSVETADEDRVRRRRVADE